MRIALADCRIPATREESVHLANAAITEAGHAKACVICFPESFVPGYRWPGTMPLAPDAAFLERAWREIADAAKAASITVILGTERLTDRGLQITACVIDADGTIAGWQDKGLLDPQGQQPDESVTFDTCEAGSLRLVGRPAAPVSRHARRRDALGRRLRLKMLATSVSPP